MIADLLILFALPALLVAAGVYDLVSFTIPNRISLAAGALFAVFVLAAGLSPAAAGWHLAAGFAGLALGFLLFALGWIGGGDAKLFAAATLWFGFGDFLNYVVAASLFGGALTLMLLIARQAPLPVQLVGQGWLLRLHDRRSGIPYGVALAAGGIALLPHSEIFRLAAGL